MEVNLTYEPFSKEPEYIQANREFVSTLHLEKSRFILDLACGLGTMTDLLLEVNRDLEIIVGLDISHEALLLAQQHFRDKAIVQKEDGQFVTGREKALKPILIQATADILPLKNSAFDFVLMGNSIHLLPDEDNLLSEIYRVLRPSGLFAFNSSFYAGTMPPGTEKFHHEWVKQAATYLLRKDQDLRKRGLDGIPRQRGTARKAFSKKWPSVDEWVSMLAAHHFKNVRVFERTVLMNQRCFETIGAYAGLASVLFSGYPVALASEALQATAGTALAAVNMEVVPRFWLEIAAVKN